MLSLRPRENSMEIEFLEVFQLKETLGSKLRGLVSFSKRPRGAHEVKLCCVKNIIFLQE
jgi:hypothetical protein